MPTSDLVEIRFAIQAIVGEQRTQEYLPMCDTGAVENNQTQDDINARGPRQRGVLGNLPRPPRKLMLFYQ